MGVLATSGQRVTPQARRPAGQIVYQPSLDGLRGVAVAGVLAFHGGFGWARGGFLGVSTFFTLSGFLITGLLLNECGRTGAIRLSDFYDRRIRRLLPAAMCCIVFVSIGAVRGWWSDNPRAISDAQWSLVDLQNWHLLWRDQRYADLFDAPSPLTHFWSLAIEEQFYIVWPLAMLALVRSTGTNVVRLRRTLWGLAGCLAGAAIVTAWLWGSNAAYLGTQARASELVIGAALAATLRNRSLPNRWRWAAVIAGLVSIVAMTTPADWASQGGLPVFALVSAALIAGLQVAGPVQRALSVKPLRLVGRCSYGVYLYHWPVFLLLSTERMPLEGAGLFGLRIAVTLTVAVVSYHLLEQPVRRVTVRRPAITALVGVSAIAAAVTMLAAVTPASSATSPITDLADLDQETIDAASIPPTEPATAGTAAPTAPPSVEVEPTPSSAPPPLSVLVVGDSTAVSLGSGLIQLAAVETSGFNVTVDAYGSCGLVRGGEYQLDVLTAALNMDCPPLIWQQVPADVMALRPDLVVVHVTLADTWPRSWDGGRTWLTPTDPEFAERIAVDYRAFTDILIAAGAPKIVWLTPPPAYTDGQLTEVEPSFVTGAQAVIAEEVEQLASTHPGRITTLDYAQWFTTTALAQDPAARPDGVHLTQPAAASVAEWLLPQLRSIADR